ncbi:MAG: tetratricopeptide repeat protein [Deltaproteobacteria bacterium]|nr:tetratricopeptide repeat protein [Nannocystaceae bacterium]
MTGRSHTIAAALVSAALTFAPLPVRAASHTAEPAGAAAEDPEALSSAAVQAFKERDFDGAVALFQRAYDIDPQPNFLFNIGRVYEEKGDLQNAVKYYQQFVKQPGVDIEARETALAHLKVLRETIEELEGQGKPPVVGPAAGATQDVAPEPVDTAAAARKRKLRIAGYSLLGVGGGALVIGAVFGGLAVAKSRDAEDADTVDETLSLRQEAEGRANVADGLIITGAVLAATGLVLVLVTLGKKKKRGGSARTALVPTFGTGSGASQLGLSLSGRF